jgi:hypothetical protein
MAIVIHKAIVVTCANPERIEKARVTAVGIGLPVSDALNSLGNGYWTFFVGPDGSEEASPDADQGDRLRNSFVQWLKTQESELEGPYYEWAEVEYGKDKADRELNSKVRSSAETGLS